MRTAVRVFPELREYPLYFEGIGWRTVDICVLAGFYLLEYSRMEAPQNGQLIPALEGCLKPGDCFWDVGANAGIVSLHFSQERFRLSRVDLFEPNPAFQKGHERLFSENPAVHVHPIGLSNLNGEQSLFLDSPFAPTASVTASVIREKNFHDSIPIILKRGDDLCADFNIPYPNVIKVDVEGHEEEVFQGIGQIIQKHRPILFFEHVFLSDETIEQMRPEGYRLEFIMDDGTRSRSRVSGAGYDAIFIPDEKYESVVGMEK